MMIKKDKSKYSSNTRHSTTSYNTNPKCQITNAAMYCNFLRIYKFGITKVTHHYGTNVTANSV